MTVMTTATKTLCHHKLHPQGSTGVYCDFTCTADSLCWWCPFLGLGLGQWQHHHGGSGYGAMVSCWCLYSWKLMTVMMMTMAMSYMAPTMVLMCHLPP
eukprot:7892962-Ditylum_brightwellii.AAC.1